METDPNLHFGCGFCRMVFPTRQELRAHKSRDHADFLVQVDEDARNLISIIQRIKSEMNPDPEPPATEGDNVRQQTDGSVPGEIPLQNHLPRVPTIKVEKPDGPSASAPPITSESPVKRIVGVVSIRQNSTGSSDHASGSRNIGITSLFNQNIIDQNIYMAARKTNAPPPPLAQIAQIEANGQRITGPSPGQEGSNKISNSSLVTQAQMRATVIVSSVTSPLSKNTEKALSPVPMASRPDDESSVPVPVTPEEVIALPRMSSSGRLIKAVKRFGDTPETVHKPAKRASFGDCSPPVTVMSPSKSSERTSEEALSTEWTVPAFRYRGKVRLSSKPDPRQTQSTPNSTPTVKLSKTILLTRSSSSSTNKVKRRTPRTRLPTDRVLFTTSIIEDSLRSPSPLKLPKSVLHVDNVSSLPLEVCYRGIPGLPQLTQSEVQGFSAASYWNKKKSHLIWPANKSIIPSVIIPDLNIDEIRFWSQQNALSDTKSDDNKDLDRIHMARKQDKIIHGKASAPHDTSNSNESASMSDAGVDSKTNALSLRISLCVLCGFGAKSSRGLRSHLKRSHPQVKASIPSDAFRDERPLTDQASCSRNIEQSEMDCSSASASEAKLNVSGQGDTSMELDPHEDSDSDLDDCDKNSEYADRGVPGGKKRKICLFCPFVAKKHHGYILHMRAIHAELCDSPTAGSDGKVTQMECPVCFRIFRYVTSEEKTFFIQHVEIHRGLRPFVCPHCERGFRDPIQLITHTSTQHTDQL